MINYDYLRPQKAIEVKKWYEKPFLNREDLTAETYKNATILPLKKFENDDLMFGRGGGHRL